MPQLLVPRSIYSKTTDAWQPEIIRRVSGRDDERDGSRVGNYRGSSADAAALVKNINRGEVPSILRNVVGLHYGRWPVKTAFGWAVCSSLNRIYLTSMDASCDPAVG